MKITKLCTFATALGMLFTSCNRDEVNELPTAPSVELGQGLLNVVLLDESGVLTKATPDYYEGGTPEEREIHKLDFFVFNSDGSFNTHYTTTDISGTTYGFNVTEGTGLKVVAAVNIAGDLRTLAPISQAELIATIYDQQIITPTRIPQGGVPMSGTSPAFSVANGEQVLTSVEVARILARFNAPTISDELSVRITADAEVDSIKVLLGEAIDFNKLRFAYKGHVVINGLKKSFYLPNYGSGGESSRWDRDVWTIGNDLSNYTASEYEDNELGEVYSGGSFLTNNEVVYLYENCPEYVPSVEGSLSGYARDKVYSMIVEGDLYEEGNESNRVTRYWRINVSKTNSESSIFKILRNSIYKVEIEKIVTAGYGTPGEAEEGGGGGPIPGLEDAGIIVGIDILEWRVFEEGTDI